ncbi:MAG TPA: ACT domain-containing protein, partial [Rhizomicrobium sp.]|nr:ACT domain-containing protein [Rhizomicrobium sp.]
MNFPELVLTISCPDRRGIVADVTRFLFERDCNILDSQQFGDRESGRFFLRMHFASEAGIGKTALEEAFGSIARHFAMEAEFFDATRKTRTLIMVSRFGHALVDLLYRVRIGAVKMEVPVIVSNHRDLEDVAAANAIPFIHLPVGNDNKQGAEARLASLIAEHRIDLVVLARYMQILSGEFCAARLGHII